MQPVHGLQCPLAELIDAVNLIYVEQKPWSGGYKNFHDNSAEHEIISANKYENSYLLAEKFSCLAMFSKK